MILTRDEAFAAPISGAALQSARNCSAWLVVSPMTIAHLASRATGCNRNQLMAETNTENWNGLLRRADQQLSQLFYGRHALLRISRAIADKYAVEVCNE